MNRTTVEILAGLGVLGVMATLHHQITRLESKTDSEFRGLVEKTRETEEPDRELDQVRREFARLVDERLVEVERRISQATDNVQDASYLKQELEAARQEAALIKAEMTLDVNKTRELVQIYHNELRMRDADVLERARRNADELERISGRMLPDPGALTRDLLLPTVQLNGTDTVGSGTLVRSDRDTRTGKTHNYVLTAYHVVRNILADTPRARTQGIPVTIYEPSGRVDVQGFLVASQKDLDVAVVELRTDRVFENIAHVLPREQLASVEVWDEIYAIGCPLGNDPIPTRGSVSSTRNVLNGTNYWMISAPTYYGNSGGGIFLADNRSLIGVFSKIYTHGRGNPVVVPHMGLCTPISAVYDWLDQERLTDVIPQAGTVRMLRPIDDEMGLAAPGK